MPRKSIVLEVFVASPSDVAEERQVLDAVVAELNHVWAGSLGVTFEVIKWETNVRPGFGVDPQEVINGQIAPNYDVFIGIFWTRLGTPTGRARSGTLEEFERAYDRLRVSGSSPEIMLYFKTANVGLAELDAKQLLDLQEFKASLSGQGGLFSDFNDQAGFEASLRSHLSAIGRKFADEAKRSDGVVTTESPARSPLIADEDDGDYGLLDFLEIHESRTKDMTAAMSVINEATQRVGEQLAKQAAEMNSGNVSPGQAKRVVHRAAEDMTRFADTLASQVAVLTFARQDAFGALSSAVSLMADFAINENELLELKGNLFATIASAATARSGLVGMREATLRMPRMSKELNRSKRAVSENMALFLDEIDSAESTIMNIIEAIDRLLLSKS